MRRFLADVLPHVIHQGGSLFVKGIDFTETKARGKVVRVEGTLRLEPKTGTRFGDVDGYYYLEAEEFELIPPALVDCVVTEEGTVSPDEIGALVDRTPFLREGYALLSR